MWIVDYMDLTVWSKPWQTAISGCWSLKCCRNGSPPTQCCT